MQISAILSTTKHYAEQTNAEHIYDSSDERPPGKPVDAKARDYCFEAAAFTPLGAGLATPSRLALTSQARNR